MRAWHGGNLRDKLGWATGPADVQQHTQGTQTGGVVAFFGGGLMVYPNLSARQIYVLYASSGWATLRGMLRQAPGYYHADHWSVFDDTFREN